MNGKEAKMLAGTGVRSSCSAMVGGDLSVTRLEAPSISNGLLESSLATVIMHKALTSNRSSIEIVHFTDSQWE